MAQPPNKRSRYSFEADVEVFLGDEERMRVHSHILMAASDVFARMLQSGMKESETGQIMLKDKSREDFETLLEHLDLRFGAAAPPITFENVGTLLSFSREYEITGLRCRCEDFLESMSEVFPLDAMKAACEFNLPKVKATATVNLLEDDQGADLLAFQSDATVRSTVWRELLRAVSKSSPDAPFEEISGTSQWAMLVEAAAAMKHRPERYWGMAWNTSEIECIITTRAASALYHLLHSYAELNEGKRKDEEAEDPVHG